MIDFKSDKMVMFNEPVDLIHTDPGHYGILVNNIVNKDEYENSQISYISHTLKIKTKKVVF